MISLKSRRELRRLRNDAIQYRHEANKFRNLFRRERARNITFAATAGIAEWEIEKFYDNELRLLESSL